MKICIFGSGGVGGYFGGRLAEAGEQVFFVARGLHNEAMHRDGLTVDSISGDFQIKHVNVIHSPRQEGEFDLVIVCVKAWQLAEAIAEIQGTLTEEGIVIPLLNGVEASSQIANTINPANVIEGLCGIVAYIERPGCIKHIGVDPFIKLGERDNTVTPRISAITALLNRAKGVTASAPDDIQVALWFKFLFIVAMSGVGAITRAPIGVTRSIASTRALLKSCVSEAATVGRAAGVLLPNNAIDTVMDMIDKAPEQATASMQRDIAAGRPSELSTQNAAVVRLGLLHNVQTPVNEVINSALTPLEKRAVGELEFD